MRFSEATGAQRQVGVRLLRAIRRLTFGFTKRSLREADMESKKVALDPNCARRLNVAAGISLGFVVSLIAIRLVALSL
jgi:hypothetical protein